MSEEKIDWKTEKEEWERTIRCPHCTHTLKRKKLKKHIANIHPSLFDPLKKTLRVKAADTEEESKGPGPIRGPGLLNRPGPIMGPKFSTNIRSEPKMPVIPPYVKKTITDMMQCDPWKTKCDFCPYIGNSLSRHMLTHTEEGKRILKEEREELTPCLHCSFVTKKKGMRKHIKACHPHLVGQGASDDHSDVSSNYQPDHSSFLPEHSSNYQPEHSSNYQSEHSSSYYPDHSSGYPPDHSSGYPPDHSSGYPPDHSSGYPPDHSSGYHPDHSSGYHPDHSSGYHPDHSSSFNPDHSSSFHPDHSNYHPDYHVPSSDSQKSSKWGKLPIPEATVTLDALKTPPVPKNVYGSFTTGDFLKKKENSSTVNRSTDNNSFHKGNPFRPPIPGEEDNSQGSSGYHERNGTHAGNRLGGYQDGGYQEKHQGGYHEGNGSNGNYDEYSGYGPNSGGNTSASYNEGTPSVGPDYGYGYEGNSAPWDSNSYYSSQQGGDSYNWGAW